MEQATEKKVATAERSPKRPKTDASVNCSDHQQTLQDKLCVLASKAMECLEWSQ